MIRVFTLSVLAGVAMTGAATAQDWPRDRMIEALDADGDGRITREEVETAPARRFAAADTDGDGSLTVAEITAAAGKRAARVVARFDEDGDGALDRDEMPDPGRRVGRLFDRADADGDGVLGADEIEDFRPRRGGGHGDRG